MTLDPTCIRFVSPPITASDAFPDLARDVDYNRHPAYRPLVRSADLRLRVRAIASFTKTFAGLLAKRVIRYEMIPYDLRTAGGLAFLKEALRNALRLNGPITDARPNYPVLASLQDHGVAVVELDAGSLDQLQERARAHFAILSNRRKARGNAKRDFAESRSTASRQSDPELYALIETLLRNGGVMDAASAYLGRAVQLVDANPQINDRTDSFWRDIFPDLPDMPLPTTAYYHRDASGGDLKAIIYLSDVGPMNGPFTYVLGSHRAAVRRIDDMICEANDHGLSATDQQNRALFAALPRALRKKGAFGNDVMSGATAERMIAEHSWSIEGAAGSIVLFDTKGVHRGGMVENGERQVITCVLG